MTFGKINKNLLNYINMLRGYAKRASCIPIHCPQQSRLAVVKIPFSFRGDRGTPIKAHASNQPIVNSKSHVPVSTHLPKVGWRTTHFVIAHHLFTSRPHNYPVPLLRYPELNSNAPIVRAVCLLWSNGSPQSLLAPVIAQVKVKFVLRRLSIPRSKPQPSRLNQHWNIVPCILPNSSRYGSNSTDCTLWRFHTWIGGVEMCIFPLINHMLDWLS